MVIVMACSLAISNRKYCLKIPYSGKPSRDKTFVNFADLEPFVKVFSVNLKCVSVRVRMRPILPLTHESFLCEIFYFHIFAKVLSLESFPLYGNNYHANVFCDIARTRVSLLFVYMHSFSYLKWLSFL